MKHFSNIVEVAPPVTYDTMHSVTLSLSDWDDIQMHLGFHAHNMDIKGAGDTANKVRAMKSRLWEQTDAALTAAADTAEGE